MKHQFFTTITDGKMQRNTAKAIAEHVKQYEGKRIEISVGKLKSIRSIQQNKYWWACITIMAKELGYTKDEFHLIAKFKLLKQEKVHEATGELLEYIGESHTLNKTEFSDMTSELIQWASQSFGIILPIPGEQVDLL